jgi:hypothetical protein
MLLLLLLLLLRLLWLPIVSAERRARGRERPGMASRS